MRLTVNMISAPRASFLTYTPYAAFAGWVRKAALIAFSTAGLLVLSACGGGGGDSNSTSTSSTGSTGSTGSTSSPGTTVAAGANVATVTIGPALSGRRPNLPYVSVTVCTPNTSTCQVIDHILVDTGSVGLRVVASALSVSLPLSTTASGNALGECVQFSDGYSWGAVRTADVKIAGESASALPIHVIGDTAVPSTAPTSCSSGGGTAENTVDSFGANGVLGVGLFQYDCGAACAQAAVGPAYYACSSTTSTSCQASAVALTSQVPHPATRFSGDSNGTVLVLPSVDIAGAATATGQLIFGIGTQSNNALGSANILRTATDGTFTATYNSTRYTSSFIDSGSNGYFFDDASITACSSTSGYSGFYCPSSTLSLSATLSGSSNTSSTVAFQIASASALTAAATSNFNALPGLAGGSLTTGTSTTTPFDFGLPFFYGRTVYTAISGMSAGGTLGPYVAF